MAVYHHGKGPDSAGQYDYTASAKDQAGKSLSARLPLSRRGSRSSTPGPERLKAFLASDPKVSRDPKDENVAIHTRESKDAKNENNSKIRKDPPNPKYRKEFKDHEDSEDIADAQIRLPAVVSSKYSLEKESARQEASKRRDPEKGQPSKNVTFAEEDSSPRRMDLESENQPSKSIVEKESRSKPLTKVGPVRDSLPKDHPEMGILEKGGSKPESRESKTLAQDSFIHWVKDDLPKELPEARVLQFKYPTLFGPDRPQDILDRSATELRSQLLHKRKNCSSRPIVFIGHDIGVLVIERALMQPSSFIGGEGEAPPILEDTAGIIYLATAPRGSDSRDYFDDRGILFGPKSNANTQKMIESF